MKIKCSRHPSRLHNCSEKYFCPIPNQKNSRYLTNPQKSCFIPDTCRGSSHLQSRFTATSSMLRRAVRWTFSSRKFWFSFQAGAFSPTAGRAAIYPCSPCAPRHPSAGSRSALFMHQLARTVCGSLPSCPTARTGP